MTHFFIKHLSDDFLVSEFFIILMTLRLKRLSISNLSEMILLNLKLAQ